MFLKIKQSIKKKFSKQPEQNACRNVTVLPDDVFLVSYPKSGNTWLRFLIANLIYLDRTNVSFSNIEKLVPDIYQNTNKDLLRLSRPRIMKSHEYFDARYSKVIYIVRDPRDVAVSYYHHLIKAKKINNDYPIDKYIKFFIKGEFHPQFGTWAENVESWLFSELNQNNFLLLKYEDMLNNSFKQMLDIALFLGLERDNNKILKAIEFSSADNMRRLEKETGWQPSKGDMIKDKLFVRTAKSDNWKTSLSQYAIEEIENNWRVLMKRLDYLK